MTLEGDTDMEKMKVRDLMVLTFSDVFQKTSQVMKNEVIKR